jgi:mono/diheme cytochrome c family protein
MMKKLFINFSSILLLFIFALIINANADELFNKGKEIFLEAGNCAACHTLSDAGSNAMIGPNLNEIRPDVSRILMAVKNGIGVMPAMEGILSNEEIEAVAHYVSISAEQ